MRNENIYIKESDIGALSLKETFYRYHAALCFFAERIVKDRMEAEDIVENVFIKLWQKESDFSKYRNIKAVLYISVKNACFDFIKKRRNNLSRQNGFTYTLQQETSFALLEIVRAEILRELYAELEKLPAECRRVMQLIFVEGWGNTKIAEHLDIDASTVRTQKARGILALRKKFSISSLLFFLHIILS